MGMGPAEIVASLKELCEEDGPRISTDRIVRWIEWHGGFEPNAELIAFAKKMKARQYARQLMYDDEESGRRVKRLWSFRDSETGERYYHDIAQLSPERRRKLIQQYCPVRRAACARSARPWPTTSPARDSSNSTPVTTTSPPASAGGPEV